LASGDKKSSSTRPWRVRGRIADKIRSINSTSFIKSCAIEADKFIVRDKEFESSENRFPQRKIAVELRVVENNNDYMSAG
jgi:hypothetical protein